MLAVFLILDACDAIAEKREPDNPPKMPRDVMPGSCASNHDCLTGAHDD
jgi:hypothetical protein